MASLRAESTKWFTDTCDIYRKTRVADTVGGETETENKIAADVPCDITPSAQQMRPTEVIGERLEIRETFTIALPPGTDVKVHDRIFITSWTPVKKTVVQTVMEPASLEVEKLVITSLEGEPNV